MGKKAQNNLIHEPLTPLKKLFGENLIFSSVLEQLLFLGKMHFPTKKAIFPKTWISVHVFGNIHIINKEV